jgi:hypothetical protein
LIANFTLDGLETAAFRGAKKSVTITDSGNNKKVLNLTFGLVRYADNFIIVLNHPRNLELIKQNVEKFLNIRGLQINKKKSKDIYFSFRKTKNEKRINTPAEVSLFTFMGKEIKDNKNGFRDKILSNMKFDNNNQKGRFTKELDEVLDELKIYYESAYSESQKSFKKFKDGYFNKKYGQYLPYDQDKERAFTFEKITDNTLSESLLTLYNTQNTGDNTSFNGKKQLN